MGVRRISNHKTSDYLKKLVLILSVVIICSTFTFAYSIQREEEINSEIHQYFIKREEVLPQVKKYSTVFVPCPNNNDIENKLKSLEQYFGKEFSQKTIEKVQYDCLSKKFFKIEADQLPDNLQACFDQISISLKQLNNVQNILRQDIIGECIIRDDFTKKINENILLLPEEITALQVLNIREDKFDNAMTEKYNQIVNEASAEDEEFAEESTDDENITNQDVEIGTLSNKDNNSVTTVISNATNKSLMWISTFIANMTK